MDLLRLIQRAKTAYGHSPLIDEAALAVEVDSELTIAKWSDWIDDSQQFHQNIVVTAAEDYFGAQKTISVLSGTQEYDLGGNELQIRLIERTDTDPDRVVYPIGINDRLLYEPRYSNWNIFKLPEFSYLWANKIGFSPKPTSDQTQQILYIRRLSNLMYGTAVSVTATTIVFPSTPSFGRVSNVDDYYNSATVRIISGTNAGQKAIITDYTGGTRTATVASWPGGTPSGTVVYEIVCDIPEQFHEAVYTYPAILAKIAGGEDPRQLQQHHAGLLDQMVSGLTPRQSMGPRYVNYAGDEGYDI